MNRQFSVRAAVTRRLLAAFLVVSVTAAFASPVALHEHASSPDCHHQAHAGAMASVTKASPGGCDQMPDAACTVMVGCASVAPAIAAVPVGVVPHSPVTVFASAANSTVHGRLVLGPPTPPPNS